MEIKLSEVLKREISKKGITLGKLSEISQVPKSTLHDWSVGRLPSGKNIHYLLSVAKSLDLSLETLLFGKELKSSEEVLFSSEFVDEGRAYKMEIKRKKSKGV